jgi:hypothetical protein
MTLTSSAFTSGGAIPKKYTCEGANISPPLSIGDIPEECDSMVLIMDDPDSANGAWTHWLVWNIGAGQTEFEEGKAPLEVTEGTTSFGKTGYGGPCPHNDQPHHYRLRIYALSSVLTSLDLTSSQSELEDAMVNCVIDQAELIGVFQKTPV